jgi:uncharacterized membrane protein YqjE
MNRNGAEGPARTAMDQGPTNISTRELIGRIVSEGVALVKKEIELAKVELKADIKADVKTAKALGVGAVLGLCALNMALVAAVLALAPMVPIPAWATALIATGVILAAAAIVGLLGWQTRVKQPLERTRRHLKEDAKWMKERLA